MNVSFYREARYRDPRYMDYFSLGVLDSKKDRFGEYKICFAFSDSNVYVYTYYDASKCSLFLSEDSDCFSMKRDDYDEFDFKEYLETHDFNHGEKTDSEFAKLLLDELEPIILNPSGLLDEPEINEAREYFNGGIVALLKKCAYEVATKKCIGLVKYIGAPMGDLVPNKFYMLMDKHGYDSLIMVKGDASKSYTVRNDELEFLSDKKKNKEKAGEPEESEEQKKDSHDEMSELASALISDAKAMLSDKSFDDDYEGEDYGCSEDKIIEAISKSLAEDDHNIYQDLKTCINALSCLSDEDKESACECVDRLIRSHSLSSDEMKREYVDASNELNDYINKIMFAK